ncbi:type VII secretion protein EssB [Amphibacillus marinus]|uniref:Type VII secretion protein EssB n=1 Tax=Amphibacillus marinus TaxID=872970 RepID=A0A1H8TVA6_9BACI|nr:type VII secretion protein EssB [Amphibacillus marinus]SEO94811.1 type VII secretion protein EssB [Amphibacillus marinus]
MEEQTIELDELKISFNVLETKREMIIPKSQTRIESIDQLRLLTEANKMVFTPMEIDEQEDAFTFSFHIDRYIKTWQDIKRLPRHEKLRLLKNLTKLKGCLSSRITFFIHPDNLVFDENLMPRIIFRGIRAYSPPFNVDEHMLLKQIKCFSVALLSNKHSFDKLYSGGLEQAKDTEFERKVQQFDQLIELEQYLITVYSAEEQRTTKTMKLIAIKQFKMFKLLTYIFATFAVGLAIPYFYTRLVTIPFQDDITTAYEAYLTSEYENVIDVLSDYKVEELPEMSLYTLARSYISEEELSEESKAVLANNLSSETDQDYLLYWVYTGRTSHELAMDKAVFLDDPQLIIYSLIKQIEQTRENPELSGNDRNDQINQLESQLERYLEENGLTADALLEGEEVEQSE